MNLPIEVILKELIARSVTEFRLEDYCFPEQLEFIRDPARFKTAVCSRRAGKTTACAAHLIAASLAHPKRVNLYITLSRLNAKKIIWGELKDLNRLFSLNATVNESELSMRFPNNSMIYLSGASDRSEIEKFRGLALNLCYLDECQSFPPYIEDLVDQVIGKALFDYDGTLCLIGTPGPVPAGFFYTCCHSPQWAHHAWTMFDNPHLERKSGKPPLELLQRDLTRMGVEVGHPTIQRECFGRWVTDPDALVFKYSREKNHFDQLPVCTTPWRYIIGVDVGFNDADALSVLASNDQVPGCYLMEEIIEHKQGVTELAGQLERLIGTYDPDRIVLDTGGLGRKIAEELRKRFSLPIHAAEKTRKFEYIELLNDAMRTGRFFAKADGRFALDCGMVEWDREKLSPERLKISDRYHSDMTDSVLYAFRESLHWLYEKPEPTPAIHTPDWFAAEQQRHEEFLVAQLEEADEY